MAAPLLALALPLPGWAQELDEREDIVVRTRPLAELPAMLEGAVQATRYNGCPAAAPVHAASRAAYVALHRWFPRSREAAATRYWY